MIVGRMCGNGALGRWRTQLHAKEKKAKRKRLNTFDVVIYVQTLSYAYFPPQMGNVQLKMINTYQHVCKRMKVKPVELDSRRDQCGGKEVAPARKEVANEGKVGLGDGNGYGD